MIGIYAIRHKASGKVYVGKSKNIKSRFWQHKNALSKPVRSSDTNRHLYNAVRKYGIDSFDFLILENFDSVVDSALTDAELHWMDRLNSCDRDFGYNLRRDSSTSTTVHPETRQIMSQNFSGDKNPNFGKKLSEQAKKSISEKAKNRHLNSESYSDQWKERISKASTQLWKDPQKKQAMALKVKAAKQAYIFLQFTKDGQLVAQWENIDQIIESHPGLRKPNLYGACDGHKPTHGGFVWRKIPKNSGDNSNLISEISEQIKNQKFYPSYSYQKYDLDGVFVCEYKSFKELKAGNSKAVLTNIHTACKDFNKTSVGFRWKKVAK